MSSERVKKRMIVLRSSDGKIFEMEEAAAIQSETLKHMIEDDCADTVIPLPNVTAEVMAKVCEYCNLHPATAAAAANVASDNGAPSDMVDNDNLKMPIAKFIEDLDTNMLFALALAANYLNIKGLLDLTCQAIANMIKDKSVEQIRELFNIKNDFTEEEEAAIRAENAWAFE